MADKRLEYKVEVDASSATSDLKKLGESGEKAGKQIADGFKDVGSKSEAAFDKVIGNLKDVTAESKRTIEVVGRIGDKFGEGFDPAATAKLVNSLRQAGVEFDTIEARADELATTMRELDSLRIEGPGAGLRDVASGLDTVRSSAGDLGTELGHVRSASDQSRSVLANLAGNSAQDLGQLGGVVGSLGVGIGQLAEYAVDGNIKLNQLASVAGPMAGLSAAMLVVQQMMKNIAETKAFDKKTAEEYAAAIDDVGDSYAAVLKIAESGGLQGRVQGGGILNEVFPRKETLDLIDQLDALGLKVADVQDVIRSGARFQEFPEWLSGPSESAVRFQALLDELDASGLDTSDMLKVLREVTAGYTDANIGAEAKARVFASTLETINEQLRDLQIKDEPLSVLQDRFTELNGQVYDLGVIWKTVVDDLSDSNADYAGTAHYVDILAEAMHLSTDEVLTLAIAQGEGAKSADAMAQAQQDAVDPTADLADAADSAAASLQAQADAMQSIIDRENDMLDAAITVADSQQEWADQLEAFPGIVEASTKAMDDSTEGSAEWIQARNDQRDALKSLVDVYVQTADLQAKQQGYNLTEIQQQDARAKGLALVADTLSDEVIPAVVDYYSQVFKIPDDKQTEFEMVLARGDDAEIEAFIEKNSGTRELAIKVTADQLSVGVARQAVAALTAPRTVPVTAEAHTVEAKGVIAGAFPPVTVPVNADASGAKQTMDTLRRNQENTPINVKVQVVGGTRAQKAFPKSAASLAATPSAASLAATPMAEDVGVTPYADTVTVASFGTPISVAGTTVAPVVHNHVTIQAAVIGSRFDVQRAVTKALRSAQRINGSRN